MLQQACIAKQCNTFSLAAISLLVIPALACEAASFRSRPLILPHMSKAAPVTLVTTLHQAKLLACHQETPALTAMHETNVFVAPQAMHATASCSRWELQRSLVTRSSFDTSTLKFQNVSERGAEASVPISTCNTLCQPL